MSLPNELKDPIDEIKTASNRVLVICLILAVMSLFGLLVALYKVGNGYRKQGIEAAAEETIYWREAYRIKDSLYSDCSNKRAGDSKETKEGLDRRNEKTNEIKKLVKESK